MGAKCVVVHEACGYFEEEDENREAVMVARLVSKSENFGMCSNRSFGG